MLVILVGALLITGTILTLGLLVVPAFLILVLVYALWQARRARDAASAPSASVPDDSASSATERTV